MKIKTWWVVVLVFILAVGSCVRVKYLQGVAEMNQSLANKKTLAYELQGCWKVVYIHQFTDAQHYTLQRCDGGERLEITPMVEGAALLVVGDQVELYKKDSDSLNVEGHLGLQRKT